MIPLSDDNPTRHAAVACRTIIVLCCLAFIGQLASGDMGGLLVRALGFTPAFFFAGGSDDPALSWTPYAVPLVSYVFLHGGWLHLVGNMLFLWVFGDDVEDAFGQPGFVGFFLLTGMVAALAQGWPDTGSTLTTIGASGAISGVLGAFFVLYPRAQVNVLVPVFVVLDVVRLPAFLVLAFWFGVQLLYEFFAPQLAGGIALRAHIGGFAAGMLLAPIFRRFPGRLEAELPEQRDVLLR